MKRYDFDCYAFYDSARLSVNECEDGDYVLYSDYAALEARHNALRESIHKAMERTVGCDKKQTDDQLIADVAYLKRLASDHFKTSLDCRNRVFAVEQQYNALREAVAWERECIRQLDYVGKFWEDDNVPGRELIMILDAARAEVDRLLEEKP